MSPGYIALGSAICCAAVVMSVLPPARRGRGFDRLAGVVGERDGGDGPRALRRMAEAARNLWLARSGLVLRRRLEDGLDDVLFEIAEGVRAGEGLLQSLQRLAAHASGPWRPLLGEVLARYDRGMPLSEALRVLVRAGGKRIELMVIALEIHQRTGGDLPGALLRLAQTVREHRLLAGDTRARTSEARWTAYLLAVLPFFLVIFMLWRAPEMLAPLTGSGVGKVALVYAGMSWLAGIAVLRRLTRFAEE